jgi:hypothetical protein
VNTIFDAWKGVDVKKYLISFTPQDHSSKGYARNVYAWLGYVRQKGDVRHKIGYETQTGT